jgi:hypothetical protein
MGTENQLIMLQDSTNGSLRFVDVNIVDMFLDTTVLNAFSLFLNA